MAITYNFNITRLTCYPEHEEQKDVVFQVEWTYRGVDENRVGSSRGGTTELTYVAGSPFTPYSQLSKDTVIQWVVDKLTPEQIAQMQSEISGDISWQIAQENPNAPVTPPLPWPRERPGV